MDAEPVEEVITPESLVTEETVKEILQRDKGKNAQLVSWEVVNFTKPGDNYICVVTSISVKYSCEGHDHDVVYIAKLNPRRGEDHLKVMTNTLFAKEAKFYVELLPELNSVLDSIGEPPLNFPRCFHSSLDMRREQIYFEDLRQRGFKMFDRRKNMDVAHTSLVLKELARLHSTSLLLQAKCPQNLTVKHDYLIKDYLTFSECSKEFMLTFLETNLTNVAQMLEKIGGYENSITWVKSIIPELEEIFTTGLQNNKYDTVCHGDCWNNNILYRYNSDGDPVEVMLLDLQVCRLASPATDLNYFFYTSINGDIRRPRLSSFLNSYYSTFKRVMDAGGADMPFSEDDLLKEFRDNNKLGAIFCMLIVPLVLVDPEEVPDLSQADNLLEKLIDNSKEKGGETLVANPLTKTRFLATFDEFIETGLIS